MTKGLEMALDHGARRLTVYADSELVVRQLNGQYRVKDANLRVLHDQALRLLHEVLGSALSTPVLGELVDQALKGTEG